MKGIKGSRFYKYAGAPPAYARQAPNGHVNVRGEREDGDIRLFAVTRRTAEALEALEARAEAEEI